MNFKIKDVAEAEKILKDFGEVQAIVQRVGLETKSDTYFIEWIDKADEQAYKDSVADASNPQAVEAAHKKKVIAKYSAIWFNEDLDPSVQNLDADDVKRFKTGNQKILVVDVRAAM